MSDRPIFHIGYHKTATTWFQEAVWPRCKSHRFVYRRIARKALLEPPGLHFEVEQARALLERGGDGRPMVVSEENLSGYIHTAGLHGLMGPEAARRIHQCYPDARILIMVRNQYEAVAACYAQYVMGGGTLGAYDYVTGGPHRKKALNHSFKNPRFALHHLAYDRLIAFYEDLFGAGQVHVMLYEELKADREAFLGRLVGNLGVRFEIGAGQAAERNVSPGGGALRLGRFINLFRKGWVADKRLVLGVPGMDLLFRPVLRHLSGESFSAPDPAFSSVRMRERIRAACAEDNAALASRRGLPLAKWGYPFSD